MRFAIFILQTCPSEPEAQNHVSLPFWKGTTIAKEERAGLNFYFIEKTRVVDCGPPDVKRIFRATAAYHPIRELKSAIAEDGQRV
jgi:hypothetical protein